MTCGYMVNVKNVDFDVEFSALKAIFPRKSLNFLDFWTSKLQKYPYLRECGYTQKSKKVDFL